MSVERPYADLVIEGGDIEAIEEGLFTTANELTDLSGVRLSYDGTLSPNEGLVGVVKVRPHESGNPLSLTGRRGGQQRSEATGPTRTYALVDFPPDDEAVWEDVAALAEESAESATDYHRLVIDLILNRNQSIQGNEFLSHYVRQVNAGLGAVETMGHLLDVLQTPFAGLFGWFGEVLLGGTGIGLFSWPLDLINHYFKIIDRFTFYYLRIGADLDRLAAIRGAGAYPDLLNQFSESKLAEAAAWRGHRAEDAQVEIQTQEDILQRAQIEASICVQLANSHDDYAAIIVFSSVKSFVEAQQAMRSRLKETAHDLLPPQPYIYIPDDTGDLELALGETVELEFVVGLRSSGGASNWCGASISVSNDLEIISVDGLEVQPGTPLGTVLEGVTYSNYPIGHHPIHTASESEMAADNQLLEPSAAFDHGQERTYNVTFRAKENPEGGFIRYRVAARHLGTDKYTYYPTAGPRDQQGWAAFPIPVNTPTSITVYKPDEQDKWKRGESYDIKWICKGDLGPNVKIELYKKDSFYQTIAESVPSVSLAPNIGLYNWVVPSILPLGSDYQIKVTSKLDSSCYGFSDPFSVPPDDGVPICVAPDVEGCYSAIQAAIDVANNGTEIIVLPATYRENIHFKQKNIILRSTEPTNPSVVAETVIDGGQADPVVRFGGSEPPTCVLSGFTIRNGNGDKGGGICGNGTTATVQHNMISGNTANDSGGGINGCHGNIHNNEISLNSANVGGGLSNCDATIQNCTIDNNRAATRGGGLYACNGTVQDNAICHNSAAGGAYPAGGGLSGCGGVIRSNIIFKNSADAHGGGLSYCDATIQNNAISCNAAGSDGGGLIWCDGIIQNNLIFGNSANSGGGGMDDCGGTIQNNTIYANSANEYESAGGLFRCNGTIRNCIIWANTSPRESESQLHQCDTTPSCCCIQNWPSGTGNISDDPRLVDSDGPDNDPVSWQDNDFRLRPDSPCIDAGCNVPELNEDFEGNGRPYDAVPAVCGARGDGTDFDIGAYEYIGNVPCGENINTPEDFPDPNLRACVEEFMGVAPVGEFTAGEAGAKSGSLNCSNRNIRDMTGLEYFTGLQSLDCSGNQLGSLDVSNNTALTELDCSHNELTSLDVSGNTALCKINCSHNKLKNLDVSNNIALTELYCQRNGIGAFLDVSNNAALTKINCSENQLESLALPGGVVLTELDCSKNLLTNLDILNNAALMKLDCSDNQLTSLVSFVANQGLGEGDTVDVRDNLLDCDDEDWEHVQILKDRIGEAQFNDWGTLTGGFAYSPQECCNPYDCDGAVVSIPTGLTAVAGDTATVPVKVENVENILGLFIYVQYDTRVIKYVQVSNGSLTSNCSDPTVNPITPTADAVTGEILIAVSCSSAFSGSGDIFEIEFEAVGNPCDFSDLVIIAAELNDVPVRTSDGRLHIVEPPFLWGDVNGDGRDGTVGASSILQWKVCLIDSFPIAPSIIKPNFPPSGEVNGDGKLGTVDASLILQKRVGIIDRYPADTSEPWDYGPESTNASKRSGAKATQSNARTVFIPEGLSVSPDNSISVPLMVDNGEGILGYFIGVSYDPSVLQYKSVSEGTLTAAWGTPEVNPSSGEVLLAGAGSSSLGGEEGSLCVLDFDVASDSGGVTQTVISLPTVELNDGEILAVGTDGTISFDTNVENWSLY